MADGVVREIGDDPERFAALVELLFGNEYRLTQRAAWPLSIICRKNPKLVQPYIHQLVLKLTEPAHPALHRNILRIFQDDIKIPEEEYGLLAEACFKFMYDAETPIAIKCFAMTVVHHICKAEPDLSPELCLYIQERLPYESPAFRGRGKKILAYWQKNSRQ